MNYAVRNAGKHRRSKTSGSLINGPKITNMILFIKTNASTGAISSIRQRKILTSRLTGWKKCRQPLKRSKRKPCKGNGRSKRKKPARKNLRAGSCSKAISFWIWRNTDKVACWTLPLVSVSAIREVGFHDRIRNPILINFPYVCDCFGRCMLQVFQQLRPAVHNKAALALPPFNPVSHGSLLIHKSFRAG